MAGSEETRSTVPGITRGEEGCFPYRGVGKVRALEETLLAHSCDMLLQYIH
jgi:hypothetical protein